MMITERSKSVIPFRPGDARRVGEGCFYLDLIVWLNGDRVEMGDRVGFNYGCEDVPDFAIAVGNPATPIRDRRGTTA